MYTPRFEFEGFERYERAAQEAILLALLEALVLDDWTYLRRNPMTPPLFAAGVRYEKEPPGRDNWQNVPRTLALGAGDCEDLASWRVAELRNGGEVNARPFLKRFTDADGLVYHIVVQRADGSLEDPSKVLGMP